MKCQWCNSGLHFQCATPKLEEQECCCDSPKPTLNLSRRTPLAEENFMPEYNEETGEPLKRGPGRPPNTEVSVKAGRMRALRIAEIPEGYVCEWADLEFAGGGVIPLIGCKGNLASDRHHGPDKSTENNSVGINLHRICDDCHNRWHVLNDPFYAERPKDNSTYLPTVDWMPHDRRTRTTTSEQARAELWWSTPVGRRLTKYREWSRAGIDRAVGDSPAEEDDSDAA